MNNLRYKFESYRTKDSILKLATKKVNYEKLTDSELVSSCQNKDEIALEHLLKRYEPIVRGMIHHVAPDWKSTDDIVQEALIRIWRSVGHLRNPRALRAWVHQIVTHLFYDELRKRTHRLQVISMDEPITHDGKASQNTRDLVDSAPQPDDKLIASELADLLTEAVSSIPRPFRIAAILRDVDGLSYEQIAQVTRTELGTVKSRIARARMKIQQRVSPYLRDCA